MYRYLFVSNVDDDSDKKSSEVEKLSKDARLRRKRSCIRDVRPVHFRVAELHTRTKTDETVNVIICLFIPLHFTIVNRRLI